MEILKQLGVNETVWIQLGFFLISYFFLSTFLFKPYRRNLLYRKKNTSGSLEEANKLAAATERLAMEYQGQMKLQNEKAMKIYNQLKGEGEAEEEKLMTAARAHASKLMNETNTKIVSEVVRAKEEIQKQIPQLGALAAGRILGREIP